MTVSAQQNWVSSAFASGASLAQAYTNTPAAGNLLVCVGVQEGDTTTDMTISDNMTDGGTWTAVSTIGLCTNATITGCFRSWWKKVGASANSNKTVTVSSAGGSIPLQVNVVEYKSDVGGDTWEENGTPSKATAATANPNPGSLTTAGAGAFVVIGATITPAGATAGAGYVRQVDLSDNFVVDIEDKFTSAGALESAVFTASANAYTAAMYAFRAFAAANPANMTLVINPLQITIDPANITVDYSHMDR